MFWAVRVAVISIHSLRVEGDATKADRARKEALFQSTPSVWRETTDGTCTGVICPISIHSLRVEGDKPVQLVHDDRVISIHSLRVEGDRARAPSSGRE